MCCRVTGFIMDLSAPNAEGLQGFKLYEGLIVSAAILNCQSR